MSNYLAVRRNLLGISLTITQLASRCYFLITNKSPLESRLGDCIVHTIHHDKDTLYLSSPSLASHIIGQKIISAISGLHIIWHTRGKKNNCVYIIRQCRIGSPVQETRRW